MLADPLTKAGTLAFPDRMVKTMMSGWLDLEPTAESQLRKLKQQKIRMERALEKADS